MQSIMQQKPKEDAAVYRFMLKKQGKVKKSCKIAVVNKFLKIYYARVLEAYQENDEQVIFDGQI